MKNHENRPGTIKNQHGTMKNHENRPGTGSQLTIMTQNEKVLIFRHTHGVTTDFLDV